MSVTDQSCALLASIKTECGLNKQAECDLPDIPIQRKGLSQPHGMYREQKRAKKELPQPMAGEIRADDYILMLMKRNNITRSGAWRRVHDGCEPITIRKVNKSNQFFTIKSGNMTQKT